MSQESIALLTAYHLATGAPLPPDIPRWDGKHIHLFLKFKEFFK